MSLSLPKRIVRLQYSIARFPLQVLEATVISRLDRGGSVRATYQQIVGTVDGTVGVILGDDDLANRGQAMRTAAEDYEKATVLEQKARDTRARAARKVQETADKAAETAREAREKADAAVAEAADSEIEKKVAAGTAAAEKLDDRTSRADDIADKRIAAAEAQREAALGEVERRAEEKKAPHAENIDEAVDKLDDAAKARADAERLADVAEAEKDS